MTGDETTEPAAVKRVCIACAFDDHVECDEYVACNTCCCGAR